MDEVTENSVSQLHTQGMYCFGKHKPLTPKKTLKNKLIEEFHEYSWVMASFITKGILQSVSFRGLYEKTDISEQVGGYREQSSGYLRGKGGGGGETGKGGRLYGEGWKLHFLGVSMLSRGLPRLLSGKEPTCQSKRCKFDPWVGKIPWRRKWQPTPVFLPGRSHGQRSLAGYSPQGLKELDTT